MDAHETGQRRVEEFRGAGDQHRGHAGIRRGRLVPEQEIMARELAGNCLQVPGGQLQPLGFRMPAYAALIQRGGKTAQRLLGRHQGDAPPARCRRTGPDPFGNWRPSASVPSA